MYNLKNVEEKRFKIKPVITIKSKKNKARESKEKKKKQARRRYRVSCKKQIQIRQPKQ